MPTRTWVNVSGLWRDTVRHFVRVAGSSSWRTVNRTFVNAGGVWKPVFYRTPGTPTSVSMTVNGSAVSPITITDASFSTTVTWNITNPADQALDQLAVWNINGTFQPPSVPGSYSATRSINIAMGQTLVVYAGVQLANGPVVGGIGTSNAIEVFRPTPSVTSVLLTADHVEDTINASWIANYPPPGARYSLLWRANYMSNPSHPSSRPLQETASFSGISNYALTAANHGYDIQEFISDEYVDFYVTVRMYDSTGSTLLASSSEQMITTAAAD